MSLNRWVFKWRLKVRMFLHSRMSAGREFQVDGAVTEKARRASSVRCVCRNDEHRSIGRAQSPRWCVGPVAQICCKKWGGGHEVEMSGPSGPP